MGWQVTDSEGGLKESFSVASQAEMEAAANTTKAVTPGRQHYHPGHPKAWVLFKGDGTVAIREDHGVSSITDNGVGLYSVNFSTAFASDTYAIHCTSSDDDSAAAAAYERGGYDSNKRRTTSSCEVVAYNLGSPGTRDPQMYHVVAYGDQ